MSAPAPASVPDVAPGGSDPGPVAPPLAERSAGSLWLEVAAVLAVGVIPHLMGAVSTLCWPERAAPYWLDSLTLSVTSGCTLFVTLYLIGRSGKPWAEFGIVRPRADDILLGGFLFVAALLLWWVMPEFLWSVGVVTQVPLAQGHGPTDALWSVVKFTLSASAEEVVTRAYLVTRLRELLRSRGEAVLVSAVLFASYHTYQGLLGFVSTLGFGLLYGSVFLVSRRLWPLVLGHTLYNLLAERLAS